MNASTSNIMMFVLVSVIWKCRHLVKLCCKSIFILYILLLYLLLFYDSKTCLFFVTIII